MKTIVVTGGNRGIGRAIAEAVVRHGEHAVVVARDRVAGEQALEVIKAAGDGSAELVVGDLGSLAGVRRLADDLLRDRERLDVLVQNAGVWPTRLELSEDGFEVSFAVNHLAPFLLNHLLLDSLEESRGRVVQVSAGLYPLGRVDLERTPRGADFSKLRTYATTKLCNLICTLQLARRFKKRGVTINAVHPGVIRTGLGASGGGLWGRVVAVSKRFLASPERGALGPIHLALDPELKAVTGRYYDELRPVELRPPALDEALAEALFTQAEELTGLVR